jgi:hypothetical protein
MEGLVSVGGPTKVSEGSCSRKHAAAVVGAAAPIVAEEMAAAALCSLSWRAQVQVVGG